MKTAQSYRTKMAKLLAFAFGVAALAGLLIGRVLNYAPSEENFWLIYPFTLLVAGAALTATLPWWRKLDDIQKSGHLVSWYWGGSAGALIVLLAMFSATGDRSDYTLGGMAVFIGQVVAYAIVWAVWRLRLRGPVE